MLSVGVTANRAGKGPRIRRNGGRERLPGHGASDHTEEDEAERAGAATAHAVTLPDAGPEPRG